MKISLYTILFISVFISCSSSSPKVGKVKGTPITPNFPIIATPLSDTEALDQVQKDAIKYF